MSKEDPLNIKTKGTLNKYPNQKDKATTKLQIGEGVMELLPSANPSMIQDKGCIKQALQRKRQCNNKAAKMEGKYGITP